MCCKNFWKRIIPFTLAIGFGLLAVNILQSNNFDENKQEKSAVKFTRSKSVQSEKGTEISGGSAKGLPPFYIRESPKSSNSKKDTLKIISKPHPIYTNAARQNQIQGIVRLRVNFLETGQIGNVSPIIELPDGLTEQAMIAARQIKFKPPTRDNIPFSTIRIVEYSFILY